MKAPSGDCRKIVDVPSTGTVSTQTAFSALGIPPVSLQPRRSSCFVTNRSCLGAPQIICLPQLTADWCVSNTGGPLELHVSTNNDAVITSIVVVDPEGRVFGGEASRRFFKCPKNIPVFSKLSFALLKASRRPPILSVSNFGAVPAAIDDSLKGVSPVQLGRRPCTLPCHHANLAPYETPLSKSNHLKDLGIKPRDSMLSSSAGHQPRDLSRKGPSGSPHSPGMRLFSCSFVRDNSHVTPF